MSDWNERAAMALGWQFVGNVYSADYHRDAWMNSEKKLVYADNWNPYGDLNQAALLEAEIERRGRGLPRVYLHHLSQKIGIAPEMDAAEIRWLYATATPAQRTEAAVLTLEGDHPEGGEG